MVDIKTTKENDICKIVAVGEVDASSSIELDNAMKSAFETEKKIIVDLSGLEYISSAGLGVFVSHLEDIRSGINLVLFGLSPSVLQVFELLGLPQLIQIASTEEEALNKLN
ncbi:MAG: STAS domain-containing protein [Cytophagales bacterium]|nr:STAS domain-containing protein [Cytophagales bacterium]